MFCINWIYALVNVLAIIVIYIYISFSNPGVFPGNGSFHGVLLKLFVLIVLESKRVRSVVLQ